MENYSLPLLLDWLFLIVLIGLWIYMFIFAHRYGLALPWGFSILFVGISLSGLGYAFHDNGTTVFSIDFMLSICLIGVLLNINNIRDQLKIEDIRKVLRFIGIGLLCGLFVGLFSMVITGGKYIQVNNSSTPFALVISAIETSVAEELLLVGYFLGYLRKYGFNPVLSVTLQSLLFTVLHIPRYSADPMTIFLVLLSGVMSGYIAWKSNSLLPSFGLHVVVNLIAFAWWYHFVMIALP
jgi:membrane protease YdiL (CAAX protease family)